MSGITWRVPYCDDGEVYITLPSALAEAIESGQLPAAEARHVVGRVVRGAAVAVASMILGGDEQGLHDLTHAIDSQVAASFQRLTRTLEALE